MKKKNLILSLIFPIICVVGLTVLLLVNIGSSHNSDRIIAVVMEACGVFAFVSVIFLKTDISRLIKWQIIYTAAAAGSLLFGFLSSLAGEYEVAIGLAGIFFPFAIIIACGITYGVELKKEESGRVLKWFTAFLSTPAVYYSAYMLAAYIKLLFALQGGLAHIG